jgi:hypothetical protein
LWEAFLDPSDSYFLFADFVDFYAHWRAANSFWSHKNSINKMNCKLMLTYDTHAYMFNVYKNLPSRQTGSRNLMGSKTLPTIWGTYMKLVTKLLVRNIVGSVFGLVRFLLPDCRLSWFLDTLNIYAHFLSHFSQQLLMAEIWYLVTSFI